MGSTETFRTGPQRYGIALLAVLVALLASCLTWSISRSTPWVFFFAAVIVTAWFSGQRPSAVATVCLATVGRYLFMTPYYSFTLDRDDFFLIVVFIGVSLFISRLAAMRRRTEAALQALAVLHASQARAFHTVLANAPDLLYTFDLDGRFTYVNRSLIAAAELEGHEVIGKDLTELGYPPHLVDLMNGRIREVIDTKGKVSGDVPYTGATGPRHYEYVLVPVLGPDGRVEAVAGSTRDITERKAIEQATRRRAEQLQRLSEIATRVNAAHDVNSVVGVVTEEARNLIGARRAATSLVLAPHPPINVVADDRLRAHEHVPAPAPCAELDGVVNEDPRPIRLSQDELRDDPRWPALEKLALARPTTSGWLAAPLVGRNGKGLGLLQLADKDDGDFTAEDEAILVQLSRLAAIAVENAALYDELRDNDRRKDEFLAMLAHELRNPLAAIGNAVNLTVRSDLRENRDWSIDVIIRQMTHLTRLIDDLLDVSRISRGKIELRKDVLEVSHVLDSAAATVGPLVAERGQRLDVAVDRGGLWVEADPTRLEQVVVNLLNNAAKYSENGRRIVLSGRAEGGEVVISVKDEGVGISPEKLPQMFELFAQGDRSLARSEGGLGIGLTVVKKLVEMHGGKVMANSEGAGRGSEFTIRLPAAEPRVSPEPQPPEPPAAPAGRARTLVVDDSFDTAQGMKRLLKILGHEVATAHDGHEALKAAREFRPEFILLDIGLPGMDGFEVAARLRQEPCGRDAVIVAVSGYGQEEDRRRSREAGFDHHLIKPVDYDALVALLAGGNGRR